MARKNMEMRKLNNLENKFKIINENILNLQKKGLQHLLSYLF